MATAAQAADPDATALACDIDIDTVVSSLRKRYVYLRACVCRMGSSCGIGASCGAYTPMLAQC